MIANPTIRLGAISAPTHSRMAKPSTALEVVASPSDVDPTLKTLLPELAQQIRDTEALARRHAKLAIAFAVRRGLLCEKAKAELPHGTYDKWLLAQGISKGTAHNHRLLAKSNTMLLLPGKDLTAPNFIERIEKDETFRASIAAQIQDVVGEATLTEVMSDIGILKAPANIVPETGKRKFYPPAPKPKEKSRDQVEKENRAAARKMFIQAFTAVKSATQNKQARRFLQAKDWIFIAKLAKDHVDALNKIAAQAQVALAKAAK